MGRSDNAESEENDLERGQTGENGALTKDDLSYEEKKLRELANSRERLNIQLTNDFAFKKVFHNKLALKGLLSAALDIPAEDIKDLDFQNTFLEGEKKEEKEGILDVRVYMNQKKINVELQMKKFLSWEERSIFYTCKMFTDNFARGMSYSKLEECIHIGILGFDLDRSDELYSVYELRERKTGRLYSDKFSLRVLYLNHIHRATEKEKQTDIYRWARLLSARDWEELKQLSENNPSMEEVYSEMEQINADSELRYRYLKELMEESDRASLVETGYADGKADGKKDGEKDILALIAAMSGDGRTEEIPRLTKDAGFLKQMLEEYHIASTDERHRR